MYSCFQLASGLSRAKSLIQVDLWLLGNSVPGRYAAVFQTASTHIFRLRQGSRISLFTQKERLAHLRSDIDINTRVHRWD